MDIKAQQIGSKEQGMVIQGLAEAVARPQGYFLEGQAETVQGLIRERDADTLQADIQEGDHRLASMSAERVEKDRLLDSLKTDLKTKDDRIAELESAVLVREAKLAARRKP